MIRRPPRSTLDRSSAASDVYKRQIPCDEATLRRVAGDLFGGTRNFRQGASGAWRQAFDAEHKQLCKAIAGDILIALGYEADDAW